MIPNPCREREPGHWDPDPYKHQIDLYWETEDALAQYSHIAEAKWRGRERVCQQEVLLLQKVREQVAAHQAFLITNSGYTGCALQVAQDEGISLLLVRPQFDTGSLHRTRRPLIQEQLQQLAQTTPCLYDYQLFHKAYGMVTPERRAWLQRVQALSNPPEKVDRASLMRVAIPRNERQILPPRSDPRGRRQLAKPREQVSDFGRKREDEKRTKRGARRKGRAEKKTQLSFA